MNAFIEYEFKVAISLAVFMLFYKLLLQKDTFHRFNRIVLLVTSALAFALPFFGIIRHETIVVGSEIPVAETAAAEGIVPEAGFSFIQFAETALTVLFFAGAAFMLMRMAYSIFKIRQLISGGRHIQQDDGMTLVVVNDKDFSPVSWMKYIVMSEEDYSSANEGILIHERAHIALGHSWDIIFFDLMTVLQWFNPAIWLLKADLRAIHEYEADEAVIKAGTDMREYQLLLVRKAVATVRYPMANSLTHSTLKSRIKMMSSVKSSLYGVLKALYVLPLVAVSLIANAETKYDYVSYEGVSPQNDSDKPPINAMFIVDGKLAKNISGITQDMIESISVLKNGDTIKEMKEKYNLTGEYDGVINITLKKSEGEVSTPEVKPTFNGGDASEFAKWVNMNLIYPESAGNAGHAGRVTVSFTINEKGELVDAMVLRGTRISDLDNEALRVIQSSPQWTPGMKDGKPVPVTFTFPVIFQQQ